MNINYPDQEFIEKINLNLPQFKKAKKLAAENNFTEAARIVAEILFKSPRKFHPLNEKEIPQIANFLNKKYPKQIKEMKLYADFCLTKSIPTKPKGMSDEYYNVRFKNAVDTHKRRASGAYILIRLYHLTKNDKYLTHFYEIAKNAVALIAEMQTGDHPPSLGWHPRNGEISGHDPSHLSEELILAFPFYRELLNTDQKLFFAKLFTKFGDFLYRSISFDTPFNIPFHFITSCHMIACVFPEFKDSKLHKTWARKRIFDDYTSEYCTTKDGYFREGVGYQNVVHNLLLKNLIFWKASDKNAPKKLLNISEKSFEFAKKIIRLDGTFPLLADTGAYGSHERHIVFHEALHKAAVFFNRPDFLESAGTPYKEEPKEIIFWDLGYQGIQKWLKYKKVPFQKRRFKNYHLNDTGLQILGDGDIKNGHSGVLVYANNINHAHYDVGSIDIWGLGRPLITDPGFTSYNQIPVWMDTRDRSHSMTQLSRLKPLGPRLDHNIHNKTAQIINKTNISGATFINTLYECHYIFRTLCLIKPTTNAADHFWLVLDTVKRKTPWRGRTEPYELAETNFHINAPQTELSIDENNFTVWSNHTGKNFKLHRYDSSDIYLTGKYNSVNFHNYLEAIEGSDSDANMQITAIPKTGDYHYGFGMRPFESFTAQYGGRMKRPAVSYLFNGMLPYSIAYILIPFRGITNKAIAQIKGEHKNNKIYIDINSNRHKLHIQINEANSDNPKIVLK